MRRLSFVLALCACSGSHMVPDAGPIIDTSCGIDCASQQTYGLIAGMCFEYSDSNTTVTPPALATQVLPVSMLEGGVPVMKMQYTIGGQIKMTDSFTISGGVLKLVRREWGSGGTSVTYQKADKTLDGVAWLAADSEAGSNEDTAEDARFIVGSTDTTESTDYRVTVSAASAGELNVPAGNFDGGVKLLFQETPVHGSDTRRVYASGVGFTLIATPLAAQNDTSQEYRLQNLKPDGGSCGI